MNYISTDFRIQHLANYRLRVCAGHQEDLFVVQDQDDAVLVGMQYPADVPPADATRILALPFRQVGILLPQHSITFVPEVAYRAEDQHVYSDYLINKNDLDVQDICLTQFHTRALFQYDSLLWHRWRMLFPQACFTPRFRALFELISAVQPANEKRLLIHRQGRYCDFLLVIGNEFTFYNTFCVLGAEDLTYYVLRIMQDFSVSRFDELWLSGIDKQHAYADHLNRYTHKLAAVPEAEAAHILIAENPDTAASLSLLLNQGICV